jgi:hypothetical protein
MPYLFCSVCGSCKPEVHTCVGAAVIASQLEEKAGTLATSTGSVVPQLAVGATSELSSPATTQVRTFPSSVNSTAQATTNKCPLFIQLDSASDNKCPLFVQLDSASDNKCPLFVQLDSASDNKCTWPPPFQTN